MNGLVRAVRQATEVRRSFSESRRSLRISLIEGIPAVILANLLGGPLQTLYLTYLGFSAFHIGLVMAIPPFTLLVQIVIAFFMQRWQNRRLYMTLFGIFHRTTWVGTGLIPLWLPEGSWVPVYIALWLSSQFAAQASAIIWTSLMADVVPPAVRGKYFGIRNTVHWGVICFTLLLGGQLMQWLPDGVGFAVLFGIGAVCIVWNGWALSRYSNPPFQPSENGTSLRLLLRPFADRPFRSATLFISLFILAQNIAIPLFSYVMLSLLNLSAAKVTLVAMLQNMVMMVSYYYWGVLNGRYASQTLLLWTFPLIAASCAIWAGMAVVPALLVLLIAHVLLGVGQAGYNLLVFNFLIGDSPKSERPIYVGVFSALTGISGFCGPIIGGWLYEIAEGGPAWLQNYGLTTFSGLAMTVLSVGVAPLVFRSRKNNKGAWSR